MDLETLSLKELKQHQKKVNKAIETFEARQLAEARTKLQAMAAEMGTTLEAVVGATGRGKSKPQSPPKYRHPENPNLTWTGKGRKPEWFKDAIEAGADPDDLEI